MGCPDASLLFALPSHQQGALNGIRKNGAGAPRCRGKRKDRMDGDDGPSHTEAHFRKRDLWRRWHRAACRADAFAARTGSGPERRGDSVHVPEGYDNTVVQILLESGRLTPASLMTMLLLKCDWHDEVGLQMVLQHGADPNAITIWGYAALHQSVRRDNGMALIGPLVEFGADPTLRNNKEWEDCPPDCGAQRARRCTAAVRGVWVLVEF